MKTYPQVRTEKKNGQEDKKKTGSGLTFFSYAYCPFNLLILGTTWSSTV